MKRTWKIRQIEHNEISPTERKLFAASSGSDPSGYVDFYEKRQDAIIKRDPQTFEKVNRVWQFDYLCAHGLKRTDRFLDYGCGPAAAGVFFIEFLEPGLWTGVDISGESIKVGRDLIRRKNLESKRPALIHIPNGDLTPLSGQQFEILLAQSVFTHLPPDAIIEVLGRLGAHMEPHSLLYASFSCCPAGINQQRLHNWYYDQDFIRVAAADSGMAVEILTDWNHPYQSTQPEFSRSTMARFRLA